MNSDLRHMTLVLALVLAVAGCSNPSDVGEQKGDSPTARAVVVGHPFTPETPPDNGQVTVSARAGSELLLSGKESESNNAPILLYQWEPVDATTRALVPVEALIVRNNSTVALTVPEVRQDTLLLFGLTVFDANGRSGRAEVRVDVEPIPDPNRFLSFIGDPRQFFVYTKLAAVSTMNATAEFSVGIQHTVTYTARNGSERTLVFDDEQPVEIEWPVGAGFGAAECGPEYVSNPVLAFDIPSLNVHSIARRVQELGEPRDHFLELRDIDGAEVSIQVTLTQSGGPPVELCPGVGLAAPGTGNLPPSDSNLVMAASATAQELSLDWDYLLDQARQNSAILDSWDSANAYYGTIDPNEERTTLIDWLLVNGFDRSAADFGADAHAVYTNNYDLGFGRDMYARIVGCDDGIEAPGNCDIAAVVINYASLEGAAKKIAPIVAVAMEYSRPECPAASTSCADGERFTKFYTYAPELREDPYRPGLSDFVQILSVDLDGRGEKFMPQVCVVCHGGRPGSVSGGVYANNGDLNSGWLTWDLDSFLYSDTDLSFSGKAADSALRARYTRTRQQEAFRKLNYLAWLTMDDAGRYSRARELVQGWYRGDNGEDRLATPGTEWAESVPIGWMVGAVGGETPNQTIAPSDAPDIYRKVFAQHCRACHVLHIPETSGQRPIGSYHEFVTATNLAGVLERGQMPMARLTMDRFWVSGAADLLQRHLDDRGTGFGRPGMVLPKVDGWPESPRLDGRYRLALDNAEPLSAATLWWLTTSDPQAKLLFSNTQNPVLSGIGPRGDQQPFSSPHQYSLSVSGSWGDPVTKQATRSDTRPVIGIISDLELGLGDTVELPIMVTSGDMSQGRPMVFEPVTSSQPAVAEGSLVCLPEGSPDCAFHVRVATASNFPVDPLPDSSTISLRVRDADGDASDPMSFDVTLEPGLLANDCSFNVPIREIGATYAARSLGLLNKCVQADDPTRTLVFELLSGPTLPHRACGRLAGSPCDTGTAALNAASGDVAYTPPQGRMSNFFATAGSIVPVDDSDTFTYRVRYEDQPDGWTDRRTVSVGIEGRQVDGVIDFASLQAALSLDNLNDSCGSCHRLGANPRWQGSGGKNGYCRITNGWDRDDTVQNPAYWPTPPLPGELPNSATAYVDWAFPQGSALYLKALGNGVPGGLLHREVGRASGTAALRTNILNWIRQGAYYTPEADQSCPPAGAAGN